MIGFFDPLQVKKWAQVCFLGRNRRTAAGVYNRAGARGWIIRLKAGGILIVLDLRVGIS